MTESEREMVRSIRREFEEHRVPTQTLVRLYGSYSPVGDAHQFIAKAVSQFPKFNAGISSRYLQHRIGRGTLTVGSFRGHNQPFLSLDEFIVDITADQFDGPPVYIGPLVHPWSDHSFAFHRE